jgi:hypothetical protein
MPFGSDLTLSTTLSVSIAAVVVVVVVVVPAVPSTKTKTKRNTTTAAHVKPTWARLLLPTTQLLRKLERGGDVTDEGLDARVQAAVRSPVPPNSFSSAIWNGVLAC